MVQLSSIVEQEMTAGVLMELSNNTSPTTLFHPVPLYGSVLQPHGMEIEELRVFHWVLLVVFMAVFSTCILLTIGIYKVNTLLNQRLILIFLVTREHIRLNVRV